MTTISTNYISKLNTFYEYLTLCEKRNLSMIIGLSVINPKDLERNLYFDIAMDYYDKDKDKDKIEDFLSKYTHNPYFIFDMDLNAFCVISKNLLQKYNNINKLNRIVFDSSTFKFVFNIKLIGLFYYLILEQGGSIYIECNTPISSASVITEIGQIDKIYDKFKSNGFCYPNGWILPKSIEIIKEGYVEIINSIVKTKEEIYFQNVEFFTKWFYGSSVELIDNIEVPYPIINKEYPINKYYKITKELTHDEILSFISDNAKEFDAGLNLKTDTVMRM